MHVRFYVFYIRRIVYVLCSIFIFFGGEAHCSGAQCWIPKCIWKHMQCILPIHRKSAWNFVHFLQIQNTYISPAICVQFSLKIIFSVAFYGYSGFHKTSTDLFILQLKNCTPLKDILYAWAILWLSEKVSVPKRPRFRIDSMIFDQTDLVLVIRCSRCLFPVLLRKWTAKERRARSTFDFIRWWIEKFCRISSILIIRINRNDLNECNKNYLNADNSSNVATTTANKQKIPKPWNHHS